MSTTTVDITPRAIGSEPAARYLGVSVKTIRRMQYDGTGPRNYRIGRRVLYDVADLDAFVEEQKAKAGA